MVFKTNLTELTGIKHPIVQGGMQYVGTAELASAVSNAGALGLITGLTQPTPNALRAEIKICRTMTDKPFGINLSFLPKIVSQLYEEYARAIIEKWIKIVETAGINHKTSMILLAKSAKKLTIPYIASGGFGDGRILAAALVFEAEGVSMGTRFMCTVEAPIHQNIKEAIVKADERSTILVFRLFHNTSRVFKNLVSVEVNEKEKNTDTNFEDVHEMVLGIRGKEVYKTGNPEFGIWTAGQVVGLIDDISTCRDLVSRIAEEAESVIKNHLNSIVVPESKL